MTNLSLTSIQSLREGMYVRFPVNPEREDLEFRDFRLGQVRAIDDIADTVIVSMLAYAPNEPPKTEQRECPRIFVQRCHILPATEFTHAQTGDFGEVLFACEDQWVAGEYCYYYVQFEGRVQRLCETELIVAAHRQDPHPQAQFSHYEFQNPIWKKYRDYLIESYAELRAATFGIEELVGSRIMLLAHQAEVVTRVLGDESCRYILADEVGLGKTIEASVILKGLRRRHPGLKALIVAPASLTRQWYYELDDKFWLDFATDVDDFFKVDGSLKEPNSPGLIISSETLIADKRASKFLIAQEWGLLIVDEAHHIRKRPELHQQIYQLSSDAERALILSATPIQRRTDEYLALLKIMNPRRYGAIQTETFQEILSTQQTIRRAIAYLAQALNPEDFDPEEFVEEMKDVLDELNHDTVLPNLVKKVTDQATGRDRGLEAAREALAYVSENYRIESRVIRNRRVNLQIELPQRKIDTSYSYTPKQPEREVIEELHDYADHMQSRIEERALVSEYCRVLFHAAFSSPHILLAILERRQLCLSDGKIKNIQASSDFSNLLGLTEPRREIERIVRLMSTVPVVPREVDYIDRLIRLTQRWLDDTEEALKALPFRAVPPEKPHRLVRTLRAVCKFLYSKPEAKIVIFSAWYQTLKVLLPYLKKMSDVAQFHCGIANNELQNEVDKFQSNPNCRIILCDELGGEGRNFQIADVIIHIDLPWTPAQLEQRIGRVDRLGRHGVVLSLLPFAKDTIEQDLFQIWEEAFQLFTHSMSGLEIVLEGIQDELITALGRSSRNGLAQLLPQMIAQADNLRDEVEEERYFEEGAINYRRRQEFSDVSEKYRDGTLLGRSITQWASLAGLTNSYNSKSDTVRYYPRRFNLKCMYNAKFFMPPNMEEALDRSGRMRNLVITGTFNRDIAVRREDLVFFAPGEPWTDTIIKNAIEADRGRSCAILRGVPELDESWQGFEFVYSIQLDPRPLYEAGFDPVHLLRGQGYLYTSTHRLIISVDGELVKPSNVVWKTIQRQAYGKNGDIHLGKRDGAKAQIHAFKEKYPPDMWQAILENVFSTAEQTLSEEFSFTVDLAEEAAEEFQKNIAGLKAARAWLYRDKAAQSLTDGLMGVKEYEHISAALIQGIQRPLWRLESACFWMLQAVEDNG